MKSYKFQTQVSSFPVDQDPQFGKAQTGAITAGGETGSVAFHLDGSNGERLLITFDDTEALETLAKVFRNAARASAKWDAAYYTSLLTAPGGKPLAYQNVGNGSDDSRGDNV